MAGGKLRFYSPLASDIRQICKLPKTICKMGQQQLIGRYCRLLMIAPLRQHLTEGGHVGGDVPLENGTPGHQNGCASGDNLAGVGWFYAAIHL